MSGLLENLGSDPYKTETREWKQKANAIRATFVCDVVEDMVKPAAAKGGRRPGGQSGGRPGGRPVRGKR